MSDSPNDTLTRATSGGGGAGRLVHWLSSLSDRVRPVRRRDVLVGAAVAGSALATSPRTYALRPVAAYDTICGPGNTAASGWTIFCATINKGANTCPPGSFAAGWWKAGGSSWCGGGYRYIVDCNAQCTKCSSGCSDHICDSTCWNCSCSSGSTATCDQRRNCCNAFRYGQCNTQVSCSGGVHCRVVSCLPPYQWTRCSTTSFTDDRTAEHSSPYLPQWGSISSHYKALGEQGGWLGASLGPVRSDGNGRGSRVSYQNGWIYDTTTTSPAAMSNFVHGVWASTGGTAGPLGYPTRDRITGLKDSGWLNLFEHGGIVDSASTSTQVVYGYRWTVWVANGREGGVLGYPIGPRTDLATYHGWMQIFQGGCIVDTDVTSTQVVHGWRWTVWQANGRESGILGYPTGPQTTQVAGGWYQPFQNGCITDSDVTATQLVTGVMWTAYQRLGINGGALGFASGPLTARSRGASQAFQKGELWALTGKGAYAVLGRVLTAWRSAGGADGSYGYPLADTTTAADGTQTCRFEGGTITA